MTSAPSLFGDDDSPAEIAPPLQAASIEDWQVELLRKTLDARGLVTMAERKAAIEEHLERHVPSLRDLTSAEAFRVLEGLGRNKTRSSVAEAWADRDEATWIDEL